MPIRIMMWNIENFTINKRNNNKWDNAQRRWNHILGTIQLVNPDIFVLIEVESGGSQEGTICGGTAAQGVLQLLTDLRNHLPNNFPNFQVVPPIVSGVGGMREGIAVFFKSNSLQFTGPYVWNGAAASPPNVPAGPVAAQAYAAPWNNALPAANNQNQKAGQFRFRTPALGNTGRRIVRSPFPSPNNRSLYLTTFLDTTVVPNRKISLFAIHSPPQAELATMVAQKLAELPDITDAPADNEVTVIVGDFNVNVIDPNQQTAFNRLTGQRARYRYILQNPNTPTALKGVGAQSRFLKGKTYKNAARIAAKQNDPALNPAYYDYIATARFDSGTRLALDNILTRYGRAAGGPAANFHVVNRAYQDGGPYAPDLGLMPDNVTAATIPLILGQYNIGAANAQPTQANSYFRKYQRFGKIGASRGASDHMALVIDV